MIDGEQKERKGKERGEERKWEERKRKKTWERRGALVRREDKIEE